MSSVLLNLKTDPCPILFPTYESGSVGGSVGSPGGGSGSGSGGTDGKMFLSHGGRPTKGNGRKRKGVDEYAAENRIDFTSRSIIRDGQLVRILVCRFCCQSIGARSDRIKEHLASKRHQKLKLEAFREAAEAGRDLSQEYSDDSASGLLLPEPPITMLKFPGKALAHLLEDGGNERDGRPLSHDRELTPEPDDRRQGITTPPPLRDFRMGSPTPPSTTAHLRPGHHQSSSQIPVSSSGVVGVGVSHSPSPPSSSRPDVPPPPPPPQQLLCVRWGNYDSNIVSMFSKLRNAEHFVDVTLWCEGRRIKCHKIVLSACSVYFEQLLVENQNVHPIIFLKDMKYWEIESLVEFMYKGETSIHQDKLQSLLRAAESLQIKGLGSPPPPTGGQPNLNNNNNNDINNNNSSSPNEIPLLHPSANSRQPMRGGGGVIHDDNNCSGGNMDGSGGGGGESPGRLFPIRHNTSQSIGMDLSNHNTGNSNQPPPSSSSQQSHSSIFPPQLSSTPISSHSSSSSSSAKRRKKETPRRIGGIIPTMIPHHNTGNIPINLLTPIYKTTTPFGTPRSRDGEEEDGAGSEYDSNETQTQNIIAVNGAVGGSDDDSMTEMEPKPLIMADNCENADMDYGVDVEGNQCGDSDGDGDGDGDGGET